MKLSTAPYKGARDFYPEDKRKQNYMFSVIRKVVKSYGYEEYDAPILEALDLYKAKSGQEIVSEQTYSFIDRGGREVAIRPEMTPSVSRMVAARRQELAYPLRWFSIPNLWRYERPQRGRLREHWQLNVDIFGVANTNAEVELIFIADDIYKAFGASSDMYQIKLNHRQLSDLIFSDYLKLSQDQSYAMAKLIDRKAKLEPLSFIAQLDEILSPEQKQNSIAEKLLNLLDITDINDLPAELLKTAPAQELLEVIKSLIEHGIGNAIFDPTLMRGFDYYSGIVFEVFDTHPENNRSMMGGGRYDGLVGLFGVEPVPTAGFGLGDATLANFLELHKLMPAIDTDTQIYIAVLPDTLEAGLKIARRMRAQGINAAVDISKRKLGDQLNIARKKQLKYVLIVGPDEIKNDLYTLRHMGDSTEAKLSLDQVISRLNKQTQI